MPAPKSGAVPFAMTPEMKLFAILFVPVVAGVTTIPAAENVLVCCTVPILLPVTTALLTSLPPVVVVFPQPIKPPSEMPKASTEAALTIPPIVLSVIWIPSSNEATIAPRPMLFVPVLFIRFFVRTVPVSLFATVAPCVAMPNCTLRMSQFSTRLLSLSVPRLATAAPPNPMPMNVAVLLLPTTIVFLTVSFWAPAAPELTLMTAEAVLRSALVMVRLRSVPVSEPSIVTRSAPSSLMRARTAAVELSPEIERTPPEGLIVKV